MEIRVLGDFEIAHDILLGVARLFNNPDGALVTDAPAALLSVFLIYSFLKWAMDNEKSPYPAKEFVLGIVFWLIFGGGPISPKYTVELTSIRENRFEVIDDVPFLAAVPSWLASNFFAEARRIMEDNFGPLHYSKSADDRAQDPLSALIKLYDNGDALLIDPYLSKSISTYMVDCYEVEQSLSGTPLSYTRAELDNIPIQDVWNGVKVTYNFLTAKYYSELNKNGVETPCPNIWADINATVMTAGSPFVTKLINNNAAKGLTNGAIEDASQMIYAATTHTSPNPTQIQQGLFLSYMMRDGLAKTNLEAWGDKMMFEAQRKRVIENAGERNMFLQLMIPIITAIETFSFFIAPVMMVLSVLGGHGLALIMKYLMLVLFVNLWGFVKVFVDLFTAVSVERAFKSASGNDPLSFGAYANTFNEIEGFLSVASSMTVAIPMFAMFLLYGGVHSVMGVMRTLGGGSVDGNQLAPTMGTSMNGNVMQMGDSGYTQMMGSGQFAHTTTSGSHAATGTGSVGSTTNASLANTSTTAKQQVTSSMDAWQQQASEAFGTQHAVTAVGQGGTSIDFSTLSTQQKIASIGKAISESSTLSEGEAVNALSNIVASGGVGVDANPLGKFLKGLGVSLGIDAGAQAKFAEGMSVEERLAAAKAASVINNWGDSDTFSGAGKNSTTYTNVSSDSSGASTEKGTSELRSASQQVNNSVSRAAAVSSEVATQQAVGQQTTINWTALDAATKHQTAQSLEGLYKQLGADNKESKAFQRLESLGIGNADDLMKYTQNSTGNGTHMAANIQTLEKLLGQSDNGNLVQSGQDHSMLSSAYRYSAGLIGDSNRTGFLTASNAHQAIADRINGVAAVDQALPAPDNSKVPTAGAVQQQSASTRAKAEEQIAAAPSKADHIGKINQDAAQAAAANDKPPVIQNGKAVNNVRGPTKEHEDLMKNADRLWDRALLSDEAKKGFEAMINTGVSVLNSGADLISGYFSTDRVWGRDAETRADRMNSLFLQQGSHSMAAEQGFAALLAGGDSTIKNQFVQRTADGTEITGLAPTPQAYAMYDAIKLLQSEKGQEILKGIPEGQEKDKLMQNIGSVYRDIAALAPEQIARLEAVSSARINGSLPDEAANVLIANANQNGGAVPLMQVDAWKTTSIPGYDGSGQNSYTGAVAAKAYQLVTADGLDQTRAAGVLVANTKALNENEVIRSMAGYGKDDKIPVLDGDAGRRATDTAKDMIINDEVARVQNAGEYNFKEGAETGSNMKFTDKNLKDGYLAAVQQGANAEWGVYANMVRGDAVSAAGTVSLFNAGLDNLANRLDAAGFAGAAAQARAYDDSNAARALNYGAVTTEEYSQNLQKIGESWVAQQPVPQSAVDAVAPAEFNNRQIYSRTTSDAGESNGVTLGQGNTVANADGATRHTSVAVAASADERVLFRGESTFATTSGEGDVKGYIAALEKLQIPPEALINVLKVADAAGEFVSTGPSDGVVASRLADAEAQRVVENVAIQDHYMNRAFNAAYNEGGSLPTSFTSDTKQTYTLVSNEGGVATYDGGDNGKFTFTPGDDRLMPTADNRNYVPLDQVETSTLSNGTPKYQPKGRDPVPG